MKSRVTTILAVLTLAVAFLTPVTASAQETGPVVFVSSTSSGNVGGVAFADEDILAFDPASDAWELVFDGSDVGLGSNDINAFHVEGDDIFMAFKIPQLLGDFTADDSDVVHFEATTLGPETAGTFSLLFDGSDVGLSKNSEEIDAISGTPDGRLLISTSGGHRVPRTGGGTLRGADEDLIVFNDTFFGDDTAGTFERYFDGSDVGLRASGEDVWGSWVHPDTGDLYLTAKTNYSVPGLRGDQEDIFTFTPTSLGNSTTGTFAAFWDGDDHGFSRERIDGFSIGFEQPPEPPQFQASLTGDWIQGWAFTPDSSVQVQIYASFTEPLPDPLWDSTDPSTSIPTDAEGNFNLDAETHGIDLAPGTYIVVTGSTKTLEMVDLTFTTFDPDTDTIGGTAPGGATVGFGVGNQVGGFDGETTADPEGNWSVNLFDEFGFVLTEDMGGQAWVSDGDGDQTVTDPELPEPPQPTTFQASLTGDWIQGWSFTPESEVTLEIFETLGGERLFPAAPEDPPFPVTTDVDGYFNWEGAFGIDLAPGTYIVVTGSTKTLEMVDLTFTTFDPDTDTIGGTAPGGALVGFGVGNQVGGFDGETTADPEGNWSVNLFDEFGFVLTEDMGGQAWVSDGDGDQTVTDPELPEPPQPTTFQASLTGDWIQGWSFTPESEVTLEIFETLGGERLFPAAPEDPPFPVTTDVDGYFNWEGAFGIDLAPGTYIVVTGSTKTLEMVDLTFTTFDPDTDTIGGTAPGGATVEFGVGNQVGGFDGETTADPEGNWSVNLFDEFGFVLTEDMGGQAWVSDGDGDQTVTDPELPEPPQPTTFQASLTGDWIQGWSFTPESEVTLEIFETLGGERLFPAAPEDPPFPVTTDVDGYFNWEGAFGIDLAPGTYIVVTGSTKTLEMVDLTFTTFDPDTDTIGGTAPGGALVGFGVGNQVGGFDGETTADPEGNWSVNLFDEFGFVLTEDMGGQAWVSDGDGDQTVTDPELPEPPQPTTFQASLTGDWIQGWSFTPESEVTLEIFETLGGERLFPAAPEDPPFPVTTDVDGYFNWEGAFGIDLAPGTYIVVTGSTKTLEMVDLTFTTFDPDTDTIGGTAPGGALVGFGVGNQVGGFDGETTADPEGNWSVNLFDEFGFVLTEDMGGQAWVSDGDGDQTVTDPELPEPPQPTTFQASLTGDWIQGWSFTPESEVTLEIFETLGGERLFPAAPEDPPFPVTTDVDGYFNWEGAFGIDLAPGTYIVVTGSTKTLEMVDLTFTTFDPDTDTIGGTAPGGATVGFGVGNQVGGFDGETTADPEGNWSVNLFDEFGFVLTEDMGGQAWVSDGDGDQTVTDPELPEPPQPTTFQASLTGDWIQGWSFTPESEVTLEIFETLGGERLFPAAPEDPPFPVTTDVDGYFNWEGAFGIDLAPGTYIVVTGSTKTLEMVDLTFTTFDPDTDTIGGTAPGGATVEFGVGNQVGGFDGETTADPEGNWSVNLFDEFGFVLTEDMGGQAWVSDGDGDQTVTDPELPEPPQPTTFQASLTGDWIQGWSFTPESEVTLEIFETLGGERLFPAAPEDPPFPVTTDVDGYFNWEGAFGIDLAPGTYIVVTGSTKTLEMVDLTFTTFDPDTDTIGGTAPGGATVEFGVGNQVGGFDGETTADPEGNWSVNLFDEFGFVLTEDMGGQAWVSDGDGDQTVTDPELPEPPPPSFSGRLLDPVGDPVAGGFVDFEPGHVRLVSDAVGEFVFEAEAGVYSFEINTFQAIRNGRPLPSGWMGSSVDLTSGDVTADLTLPFFEFDVRVENADGTPVGSDYGARVVGYSEFDAGNGYTLTGEWQSGTGAGTGNLVDGELQLHGYGTVSGEVTVAVYPPGAPARYSTATLTPGTTIVVVLADAPSFSGRLLDPVGDPVAGGFVDFEPGHVRLVSDAVGEFVFEAEAGVYSFEINTFQAIRNGRPLPSGWMGSSVDLTSGDVTADLTLPFFEFDVRVENADGTPVGSDYGARVVGYSEFDAGNGYTLTGEWQSGTGAGTGNLVDGELQLHGYGTVSGEVTVAVYPPGAPARYSTATLTPGTTIVVVLS